ncbi:hypothetical protein BT67DRAFT_124984 [Trichocladium antarcticum]|uniref:Uncharacterized protein n=1 Tax=Trichocladium antarcticum TaxID=1450529 RepID=A0AAN6US16_9PEZI|nr:hypothetical protein BT67DRAFT_124984 [Trichocladium antarcticum]
MQGGSWTVSLLRTSRLFHCSPSRVFWTNSNSRKSQVAAHAQLGVGAGLSVSRALPRSRHSGVICAFHISFGQAATGCLIWPACILIYFFSTFIFTECWSHPVLPLTPMSQAQAQRESDEDRSYGLPTCQTRSCPVRF